jgi:hypothetical protein
MKTRVRIALLFIVAAVLLSGCFLLPVSIDQRINDFVSDLSGNRTNAYMNLDPGTSAYSNAKAAGFWDATVFGNNPPYSHGSLNVVSSSDVECTISDASVSLGTFQFVMVNIGTGIDNWVINDIRTPPGGSGNSIF